MTAQSPHRPRAPGRSVMAIAALLMLPGAPTRATAEPVLRLAQQPPIKDVKIAPSRAERERELESVRVEQQKAADAENRLRGEVAALGEDRRKLNQSLIETANRLRAVEARMSAADARLKTLEDNERTVRASLSGRRATIAEVLAALQRIGRRPPPALMVTPQDALTAVRTAILLGAVLPEMRVEAEALAADLAELLKVRREIGTERETQSRDLASLGEERSRMSLLVEERQRRQADAEKALAAEHQRAVALARQADNLKDLIGWLEKDVASAARAADAANRSSDGRSAPADARSNLAALKDPGRLTPAIAFASARGVLPLPVNGVKVREFGASDGLGGSEKGLSIASRTGAQVTAPCDGWVVYAGPFRSYGQLLILNAGGGYHVLLAGMERISVDLGQFVLTGEPVAVMGGGPRTAAAVAIGSSQPILYVEFRKDGTPIDPGPWWAAQNSEKVRG